MCSLKWAYLFILLIHSVQFVKCLSPRQYYWWLQRQQRHRHLHGPNVCTVEKIPKTSLAFHTECQNWVVPRNICGVEAELSYECCAGFAEIKGQPGCSAAGVLENILVTLRHVGAEWMATRVMSADEENQLTPRGAITVFAPTESAWSKSQSDATNEINSKYKYYKKKIKKSKDKGINVTLNHVVKGRHRLSDFKHNTVLNTMNGAANLMITKYKNGMTAVNCARVLAPNREATDGVIHVIESVLLPPDGRTIAEVLSHGEEPLGQFAGLLRKSGLLDKLANRHRVTVFAPTDKAFNKLQQREFSHMLRDKGLLKALLRYHIVDDLWCSAGISTTHQASTLEGTTINMTCSESGLKVNRAQIIKPDMVVKNGIIHVIDEVLFPTKVQNLWSLLSEVGSTKMSYFMGMTGLNTTLSLRPSLTVFAPSNNAFNGLSAATIKRLQTDPEYLNKVLSFHVASGRHQASQMVNGQRFKTVEGRRSRVFVYPWRTAVESACVLHEDIMGLNGIIHMVDTVMLPPEGSVADIIATQDEFTILGEALQLSGLVTVFQSRGAFTLFAPTNNAFQNLPSRIRDSLLRDPTQLIKILRYHVIGEIHVSCSIKSNLVYPLVSLLGQEVRLRRQGEKLLAENAIITEPDIMATNGVIQVIDRVLMPT